MKRLEVGSFIEFGNESGKYCLVAGSVQENNTLHFVLYSVSDLYTPLDEFDMSVAAEGYIEAIFTKALIAAQNDLETMLHGEAISRKAENLKHAVDTIKTELNAIYGG